MAVRAQTEWRRRVGRERREPGIKLHRMKAARPLVRTMRFTEDRRRGKGPLGEECDTGSANGAHRGTGT
ncbi:hypothetical protein NDU88_005953 [Pleurodeles waltl]|uniref:Uncharacterized protein n=1 Tax=Pleurodeles waltl TaxID=8319 RepID=A0AAV7TWB8_PLEWA|nr:hypothetical protein NDU88_005953 [Pleurodeles waltl]